MIVKVAIPEEHLEILRDLISLTEKQQDFLLKKLETFSPKNRVELSNDLSKLPIFNKINVEDVIWFVIDFYLNYYMYSYGKSKDEFIDDIIVNSIKRKKIDLEINERTKNILKKILSMEDTVGVIAKISPLHNENPNLYMNSQIITDLRHIFYNDPSRDPKYAIIKHTLKIRYFADEEFNDIFLTLDSKDLLKLKKSIKRAISKEKTLKSMSKQKELTILEENE